MQEEKKITEEVLSWNLSHGIINSSKLHGS